MGSRRAVPQCGQVNVDSSTGFMRSSGVQEMGLLATVYPLGAENNIFAHRANPFARGPPLYYRVLSALKEIRA